MSSTVGCGSGGFLCRLGERWRGVLLPEAEGGRRRVHGRDEYVFRQPFHHKVVFHFQVSGDGGFHLQGERCGGAFWSIRGMCRLIWRRLDGASGGLLRKGDAPTARCSTRWSRMAWWWSVAGRR